MSFESLLTFSLLLSVASGASLTSEFLAFDRIEAEDYSYVEVTGKGPSCSSLTVLGRLFTAAVAGYFGVDFGSGANLIELRMSGARSDCLTGSVNLRLDSPQQVPVATIPVGPTGGECDYVSILNFLPKPISGVHDLYLTFEALPNASVIFLDWFQFHQTLPCID